MMDQKKCFNEWVSVVSNMYAKETKDFTKVEEFYKTALLKAVVKIALVTFGLFATLMCFGKAVFLVLPLAGFYLAKKIHFVVNAFRIFTEFGNVYTSFRDSAEAILALEYKDYALSEEDFVHLANGIQERFEKLQSGENEKHTINIGATIMELETIEEYKKVLRWYYTLLQDFVTSHQLTELRKYHRGEIQYTEYSVEDKTVTLASMPSVIYE